MMRKRTGFLNLPSFLNNKKANLTLVEIAAALVVAGTLAAVTLPSLQSSLDAPEQMKICFSLKQIDEAQHRSDYTSPASICSTNPKGNDTSNINNVFRLSLPLDYVTSCCDGICSISYKNKTFTKDSCTGDSGGGSSTASSSTGSSSVATSSAPTLAPTKAATQPSVQADSITPSAALHT
ncbi:MAG: type II secretion system protein [Candidatus Omnitrophica bacterium]|nr:type II secretion system protein [Candidatus Omnitrophota bacterium]